MQRANYKRFEKAYKYLLRDTSNLRNFGGLTGVVDHKDIVNDAYISLHKKYDFINDNFSYKEILTLFRKAIRFRLLRNFRYEKNKNEMVNKVLLSDLLESQEPVDKNVGYTGIFDNFEISKLKVEGYTEEEIAKMFNTTRRVIQYKFLKEKESIKCITT